MVSDWHHSRFRNAHTNEGGERDRVRAHERSAHTHGVLVGSRHYPKRMEDVWLERPVEKRPVGAVPGRAGGAVVSSAPYSETAYAQDANHINQ